MNKSIQPSNFYRTIDIIEAVDSHPDRWGNFPLETALSLPVPLVQDGKYSVVFFIYPVGGPITNRLIRSPIAGVIASATELDQIQFIPVTPQQMGLDVEPGAALERMEPTLRGEGAESYDNLMAQLCATVDHLLLVLPKAVGLLSESDKQNAQTYQNLLEKMAQHSLIPAYKALNPHFFDWLDSMGSK
jgi:hypothetical protein